MQTVCSQQRNITLNLFLMKELELCQIPEKPVRKKRRKVAPKDIALDKNWVKTNQIGASCVLITPERKDNRAKWSHCITRCIQ